MIAERRRELKGLLAEKESRRRNLEAAIANHLLVINAKANPFLDDLSELDADAIFAAAEQLKTDVAELRELKQKIREISKELLP